MYAIKFVSDDALPAGYDFVIAQDKADCFVFYRRSALTEQTLEDSWDAYRALVKVGRAPLLRCVS